MGVKFVLLRSWEDRGTRRGTSIIIAVRFKYNFDHEIQENEIGRKM
jgi:hypothetical protein